MPPKRRDVDRVSRLQHRRGRGVQRLPELRVRRQVGGVGRDHAHRLARDGELQGTDVEIGDLLGGKQREAAAAGHDAGDVVRLVEMRRDLHRVAEPDPGGAAVRLQPQAHLLGEAGQMTRDIERADVDRGRGLVAGMRQDQVQRLREGQRASLEVETGQGGVIEEPAGDRRGSHERLHGAASIMGDDVIGDRPLRTQRLMHRRPVARRPPHHQRPVCRQDRLAETGPAQLRGGDFHHVRHLSENQDVTAIISGL